MMRWWYMGGLPLTSHNRVEIDHIRLVFLSSTPPNLFSWDLPLLVRHCSNQKHPPIAPWSIYLPQTVWNKNIILLLQIIKVHCMWQLSGSIRATFSVACFCWTFIPNEFKCPQIMERLQEIQCIFWLSQIRLSNSSLEILLNPTKSVISYSSSLFQSPSQDL